MRSEINPHHTEPATHDIVLGQLAEDGAQLRPHIVWFGEEVPMIPFAIQLVEQADVLVIIGTSLQVYPAASLIEYAQTNIPIIVIDCWEHTYYRDYLKDRRSYVFAMMKELKWDTIEERIRKAERMIEASK